MAKKTFSMTWKATLTFKQWWLRWCPDVKRKEARLMWDRLGKTIPMKCVNDCGPTDTTQLGYAHDDGLDDLIRQRTEEAEAYNEVRDNEVV